MEEPPKKFFRLSLGKEVRIKFAYYITCNEVIKDGNGKIIELRCTYDPETRGGRSKDGRKVAFTNKRVLRLVNRYDAQLQKFRDAYLLDLINFSNGETVIDCGANIGELNISLKEKGLNLNYIAFEPDKEIFDCLSHKSSKHLHPF